MGTNYYIKPDKCKVCGRSDNYIHLGKSSYGWKFAFNLNGARFYKNVTEMKKWLRGKRIEDEYGKPITKKAFWNMIAEKQKIVDPEETDAIVIDGYKFYDHEFL